MIIKLDDENLKINNLTLNEALILLFTESNRNINEIYDSLMKKGFVKKATTQDLFQGSSKFLTTEFGKSIVKTLAGNIVKRTESLDRCTKLAKEMKALFPKGMKPGTNIPWAEGPAVLSTRLRRFFELYDPEGKITDEEIIDATRRYVATFHGGGYMRSLRYFIFKNDKSTGMVEESSDLLTYITNKDEVNTNDSSNWVNVK